MQPSKKRSVFMSTLIKEGLEARIKAFGALHNYQYFRQSDWDSWERKPMRAATLYDYFSGGWEGILRIAGVPEELWHRKTARLPAFSNEELLAKLELVEDFIKSRPIPIKESDIEAYNAANPENQVPSRKTYAARFGSMAKANEAYQKRIQILSSAWKETSDAN